NVLLGATRRRAHPRTGRHRGIPDHGHPRRPRSARVAGHADAGAPNLLRRDRPRDRGLLHDQGQPRRLLCGDAAGIRRRNPGRVVDAEEGPRGAAPFRSAPVSGAVALCLFLAVFGIGAAKVPGSAPQALCIPLLVNCSAPAPMPSPTPTKPPDGLVGGLLGSGTTTGGGVLSVLDDPNAPVMTMPAAQLNGSSLSFTGLQSVTLVTIRLVTGARVPVLRLVADSITINNFLLDVRRATGPSL